MTRAIATARTTQADVDERMAFADAALAVAGHEITDPELRALGDARARGELSGEDFRSEARRRILGR